MCYMTSICFKCLSIYYPTLGSPVRPFLIAVNATQAAVPAVNTNGLSFEFAINSPLSKFIPIQNITIHPITNGIKLNVLRLPVDRWACMVLLNYQFILYRIISIQKKFQ